MVIDLDVDAPWKVADLLRQAAQSYRESATELDAAWQDRSGRVWATLATILDRAAASCDAACEKKGVK